MTLYEFMCGINPQVEDNEREYPDDYDPEYADDKYERDRDERE